MSTYYESHFQELCQIGSGGYSTVFKAKYIESGKEFAIKKIPVNDEDLAKAFKEINFLGTLNSDYIVEHIHSWVENNYYNTDDHKNQNSLLYNPEKPNLLHIQMELCSITLDDFIKSMHFPNKNSMTQKQYSIACDIFTQLLECVQYLHERNPPIIHRDLKPQNILLTNSANNRCVKLTDFGLSTYHEFAEQSHTKYVGTPFYKAPEVLNKKYTTKADIYSLGIIMEEIFNIDIDVDGLTIENNEEIHRQYSKITDICGSCLSQFSSKRPNCLQILNQRNEWKSTIDTPREVFCKINELIYENLLNCNIEKWPSITSIDLGFIKNCKYISIIEEIEEKAIFVTKDRKTHAIRVSDHIDSTIQDPIIIYELSNQQIKSIVCGDCHVLCLTKDMRVYSFGDNTFGQLGNAKHRSDNKPSVIKVLSDKRIIDLKCGAYHSLALSESGRVFVWGYGVFGQCGNGESFNMNTPTEMLSLINVKIISISCGYHHSLALSESGTLYGWGINDFGQLGIGNNDHQYNPILISFSDQIRIKKIRAGCAHSIVLTSDNVIYSFGYNIFGQLGIGSYVNQNKPTKIQTSIKFIDIETTFYHRLSVGLSTDNKYYVWGKCNDDMINTPKHSNFTSFNEIFIYNSNTMLLCQPIITNDSFFVTESSFLNKFKIMKHFQEVIQNMETNIKLLTFIKMKECKVIIVSNDDMVYSIPLNENYATIKNTSTQVLSEVKELSNKRNKNIICGFNHVLCLTEKKEVYAFGENDCGQLGYGSQINNYKPSIIIELTEKHIIEISCGAYHSLGLCESGRVFVWGDGYFGQIGNGLNYSSFTPIELKSLNSIKIVSISCGAFYCLALSSSGDLYGWGSNKFGQLGIGNNTDQKIPILIDNNHKIKITKISCGYNHSLLLTNDHNVYSFGSNNFGQLGSGYSGDQSHRKIMIKIKSTVKFIDIHTTFCDDISAGLSQTGKYYIWGKCGDEKITTPTQTDFTSFDALFAKYSDFKFTHKQLNLKQDFF